MILQPMVVNGCGLRRAHWIVGTGLVPESVEIWVTDDRMTKESHGTVETVQIADIGVPAAIF